MRFDTICDEMVVHKDIPRLVVTFRQTAIHVFISHSVQYPLSVACSLETTAWNRLISDFLSLASSISCDFASMVVSISSGENEPGSFRACRPHQRHPTKPASVSFNSGLINHAYSSKYPTCSRKSRSKASLKQ